MMIRISPIDSKPLVVRPAKIHVDGRDKRGWMDFTLHACVRGTLWHSTTRA